jgi:hypothetical protein
MPIVKARALAVELSMTIDTVWRWTRERRIPYLAVPGSRSVLHDADAVLVALGRRRTLPLGPIIGYDNGIPVVPCTRDRRGNAHLHCPFCGRLHSHGIGDGGRLSHCLEDSRPYSLATGEEYATHGFVFAGPRGEPLRGDVVGSVFKRTLRKAKLPAVTLYSLRHTAATMLLEAGVPLKVVSERPGHSSITLTADVYSHVGAGMQASANKRLEAYLTNV